MINRLTKKKGKGKRKSIKGLYYNKVKRIIQVKVKMEKTNLNDGKGRFLHVPSKTPMAMLKVGGIFDESPIAIAICPTIKEKFINVDLANQLQVPKSSIVKNK